MEERDSGHGVTWCPRTSPSACQGCSTALACFKPVGRDEIIPRVIVTTMPDSGGPPPANHLIALKRRRHRVVHVAGAGVETMLAGDPFVTAGLYSELEIHRWEFGGRP